MSGDNVRVDRMTIDIATEATAGSGQSAPAGSGGSLVAGSREELKAMLRPLVVEIVAEVLQSELRSRGR